MIPLRPLLLVTAALALPLAAQPPAATTAAQPAAPAFDAAVGAQAVTVLAAELEKGFLYPDVGRAYAAMLRRNLAAGTYASFPDAQAFADRVTGDLQAIHADGHLRLVVPGGGPPRRVAPASAGTGGRAPAGPAPLMEQAGWIAPGIGYVRFNAFTGNPQVLADFATFLDSIGGAKALIIDARTHHGGGIDEMNVLLPRLFTTPQTVMVMDTRASLVGEDATQFDGLVKVAGTADISRAEHRISPLASSRLAQTRVYYLISGRSASAAEHLATVFKYTHRATLIGDTTAGAGNYGGIVALPGGYSAFIAGGHSYYPGTKGWEGTGVEPDVKVAPARALVAALTREGVAPAEAEELSASHMPAEPMTRRVMPKS